MRRRHLIATCLQVRPTALSCVTKDITEPGDYGGFPAVCASQQTSMASTIAIHDAAANKHQTKGNEVLLLFEALNSIHKAEMTYR
ncbi:hypothetical protein MTR_7g451850 [Medicago truncatula]|uniref:Uncharacterized protein n=1 Tax=Medicago truncatula TaxID=3880 RepID=A0A072U058_MEDTR|nr:hypothetical protein MTR_7g451850 [Medicago truncatula]